MDKLKCPVCGNVLELEIGYTGCEWNCKEGEGSGYGNELSLVCHQKGCGRIYTLGHLKNAYDFSEVIDKYKCVK